MLCKPIFLELLGYDNDQSSDVPLESPLTPSSAAKKQRPSSLGTDADWNLFLESDYHKHSSDQFSKILHLHTRVNKTVTSAKHSEIQVNTNSVLFPCIRVIHYTLHLVYEELKLHIVRTEELPYLGQFLSKLACSLNLREYVIHYWKDFPEHCLLNFTNPTSISSNNLKNTIQWSIMNEKPESIMEHIYNLLMDVEVSPFPYIFNVNERSKAIVQVMYLSN